MNKEKRQTRNTVIFAVVLLLVLGAGFCVTVLLRGKTPGMTANIQVDGESVARLDLSKDTQMTVGGPDTDYNVIEVKDGTVCVLEADCPDKICVQTGRISQEGEIIACLPHKLIIVIEE